MGVCVPMTWFWGNLTASKDDNKDKDHEKIKWSNCDVILYLCSSVLTAIWLILYITNQFAAFFGAFLVCVGVSVYSLIHFRDLFGIGNEVNEATDHCHTMQQQEKALEDEIKHLETISAEMKKTQQGIQKETKDFTQENAKNKAEVEHLKKTVELLQTKKNQFKDFVDELKDDSQKRCSELKSLAEQVNDLLDFIKRAILEKEYNIYQKAFKAAEGTIKLEKPEETGNTKQKAGNINKAEFMAFLDDLPNGFQMKILNGQNKGERFDFISTLGEDEEANDNLVNWSELQKALKETQNVSENTSIQTN